MKQNYNEDKYYDTWEEVFYDYIKQPGWNNVRIGFRGIEYNLSQGDFISFKDRNGERHSFQFPADVETLLDAHVLEDGFSPRDLMRRDDLEYFAMD